MVKDDLMALDDGLYIDGCESIDAWLDALERGVFEREWNDRVAATEGFLRWWAREMG